MGFTIFCCLFLKKSRKKVTVCFFESRTKCENTLFRCSTAAILTMKAYRTSLWSEISCRKPPRTCIVQCTITRIFLHLMRGGPWWKSTNDRRGSLYRIHEVQPGHITWFWVKISATTMDPANIFLDQIFVVNRNSAHWCYQLAGPLIFLPEARFMNVPFRWGFWA